MIDCFIVSYVTDWIDGYRLLEHFREGKMIRDVVLDDAQQICDIYNYYILNTYITFEEESVSLNEMKNRISEINRDLTWLVYDENSKILGYAYIAKWKTRSAYKYSVESTVYLDKDCIGKGIGSKLYAALLERTKLLKKHVIIGGIALPNENSVKLHEKFGFKKMAHFTEVGFKQNRWIDVGYWELII